MILGAPHLEVLLECAIDAAQKGAASIRSYTGNELSVQGKEGGFSPASQIVTEADLQSQRVILETLEQVTKRYDLGTLCEESADNRSRLVKEYFWSIDPLDGTLPFTKDLAGYSVSIALVSRQGDPLLGVICDPRKGTIYSAIRGGGAFKNRESWKPQVKEGTLTLVCDSSFLDHSLYGRTIETLNHFTASEGWANVKLRSTGGAAMNGMWVLEEAPALYFKFPRNESRGGSLWDYAASALIVNEAGGRASHFTGGKLKLNNRHTTFMNKEGIFYISPCGYESKLRGMISSLCP